MNVRGAERKLPDDWDEGDEAGWPEALVAAVAIDVSALRSPRAQATLRGWRQRARSGAEGREDALRWLERVADALVSAAPPPAMPREDSTGPMPLSDRLTEASVRAIAREIPLEEVRGEDVVEIQSIDPLLADLAGERARPRQTSSPPPARASLPPVRASAASAPRPSFAPAPSRPSAAPPLDFSEEPPTAANARPAGFGAPARASVPPPSAAPRASIQQVRALAASILPLCRELVPLNYERRSRRFWARWREVSGERGIHREAAERILASDASLEELLAQLTAEILGADLSSVRAQLERVLGEETKDAPGPRVTAERARGPLVGASVRVEGLSADGEEER